MLLRDVKEFIDAGKLLLLPGVAYDARVKSCVPEILL